MIGKKRHERISVLSGHARSAGKEETIMYVKVLYDNNAKKGLETGHGFSCLIDGKVLFDTGGDAETFMDNMKRMMVNIEGIEKVVISHDHWDHTGGLWHLLKLRPGLKVHALGAFSDTFKKCVAESGGDLTDAETGEEIYKGIYSTGPMDFIYKGNKMSEQSLAVRGEKGLSIITGCAHPGIVEIIKKIKRDFSEKNVYMVFGGLHLRGTGREDLEDLIERLRLLKVEKVAPCHCSGDMIRRMLGGRYLERYIPCGAGYIIRL